jgi:Putative capsular polysaccharide synthesis protein
MHLRWGLRRARALLMGGEHAADKRPMEEKDRIFRHIWHRLAHAFERGHLLQRGRPNAVVLQMGKVASTSIQSALLARRINAFHSHGLSSPIQRGRLSPLLEADLTFRLAAHDLRRHIQSIALHMMLRWYRKHKQYKRHRLKVITLTRDPVTHYPSAFLHRRDSSLPDILSWHRARTNLSIHDPADETQALTDFLMELASILVDGRPSDGDSGVARCVALVGQRWPEHPVFAVELHALLVPLIWFDSEITAMFGMDMLAAPGFRERGWAEQSNEWVDLMVVKFEDMSSLVPEIQRFFGLGELALARENQTSGRTGAVEIATAWQAMMTAPIGQACARELRTSPYGRACGYDRLT